MARFGPGLAALPPGGKLGKGLAPGDILPPIAKPLRVFGGAHGRRGAPHRLHSLRRHPRPASGGGAIAGCRRARHASGRRWRAFRDWGARLRCWCANCHGSKVARSRFSMTRRRFPGGKGRDLVAEDDVRADLKALPSGFPLVDADRIAGYPALCVRGFARRGHADPHRLCAGCQSEIRCA